MPKWSTEAKNLDTANSKREEHIEQQERIKRTDRAVPTASRDVRREQCLEERSCHRRMAAEQELKVAEKGGELQVNIEEEIGVEE